MVFKVAFVRNFETYYGVCKRITGKNLSRNVVFQGTFGKVFNGLGTIWLMDSVFDCWKQSLVIEEESVNWEGILRTTNEVLVEMNEKLNEEEEIANTLTVKRKDVEDVLAIQKERKLIMIQE
jgi:hypothetical protein